MPEVANARAQLTLATGDFDRAKMLFDKKLLSQADFDQRSAQAEVARRQFEIARNGAMQQYQGLLAARARVVLARKALADTIVKAPFAGVVGERLVSVGDYVQRGTKVASVLAHQSVARAAHRARAVQRRSRRRPLGVVRGGCLAGPEVHRPGAVRLACARSQLAHARRRSRGAQRFRSAQARLVRHRADRAGESQSWRARRQRPRCARLPARRECSSSRATRPKNGLSRSVNRSATSSRSPMD